MIEWKLVPMEPTQEMVDAGVMALFARENDEMWTSSDERVAAVFRAMLSAAPEPPEVGIDVTRISDGTKGFAP